MVLIREKTGAKIKTGTEPKPTLAFVYVSEVK